MSLVVILNKESYFSGNLRQDGIARHLNSRMLKNILYLTKVSEKMSDQFGNSLERLVTLSFR